MGNGWWRGGGNVLVTRVRCRTCDEMDRIWPGEMHSPNAAQSAVDGFMAVNTIP